MNGVTLTPEGDSAAHSPQIATSILGYAPLGSVPHLNAVLRPFYI